METKELLKFIESNIPNLTDLKIITSEKGYHYTMHSDCIESMGKFLGRPVDENLDRSQNTLVSIKTTDEKGIVCAYPELSTAVKEGKYGDCHIYEIHFSEAISACHQQEQEFTKAFGNIDVPKTLFILVHKIVNFRLLGKCSELKNKLS